MHCDETTDENQIEEMDESAEARKDIEKMTTLLSEVDALVEKCSKKAAEMSCFFGPVEYGDWSVVKAHVADAKGTLAHISENYYPE